MKHPWHEIPYGNKAPDIVNAIIEIPKGSRAKYEVDKASEECHLRRLEILSGSYFANPSEKINVGPCANAQTKFSPLPNMHRHEEN